MIKIFTTTFLILSITLFSQNRIKILDSENQKPIAYAKLILKNKDYYKNTEENGETMLEKDEEISEIQSFGFENLHVEKFQQIYLLKPKFSEIETVEISKPKFQKKFTVGSIKKSNMGFAALSKSWVVVDLFKNNIPEEKVYIKKIKIPTQVDKTLKEATFNLVFYENINGKPSSEKRKNIIVTCKSGKNITEVDLTKSPISFPKEGLFIGFEWILNEQNKYSYTTDIHHLDGTKEEKCTTNWNISFFQRLRI
ncbi:thioredoxin domain-containing protein [Chryseobacterium terrae]|uniref:Uncharacterized protein n=1 Tax=Chryseobacterium terrae TaxID=3163299 RepID=A0ABW8Y8D6_9FLAO